MNSTTRARLNKGRLEMQLNGDDIKTQDPEKFDDDAARALGEQIKTEPAGTLILRPSGYGAWSAIAQYAFLLLWAITAPLRKVEVKIDKTRYTEAPGFITAALPKKCPKAGIKAREKLAVAALSAGPEASRLSNADKLATWLTEGGGSALTATELLTLVKKASAKPSNPNKPNPTLLAEAYILRYRNEVVAQIEGSEPTVLHYYQGCYYQWDEIWKMLTPDIMSALVTKNLQKHSCVDQVTRSLISSVMDNLKGESVLHTELSLPFWIHSYSPLTVRTRMILQVQNGLLDFAALTKANGSSMPKLRPHDPRWFSTSALPYVYDPDAQCDRFLAFVRRILNRDALDGSARNDGDARLEVLQEWFGYSLLPDGRFQKFLIMVGEGANGKGVLQRIWGQLLGDENVSHVSLDQLGGEFGLQPLVGKLANICGDLCEIDSVAEGVLKRLVGEDKLTVNRKHLPALTVAPTMKLIFATNALPRFIDRSKGIWRRLIPMPFDEVIPAYEQNPRLSAELAEELPGILNWAIEGLRRLLIQNGFSDCERCTAASKSHQYDCDPVKQFLDESDLQRRRGEDYARAIEVNVLYKLYRDFCEESGNKPLAKSRFNKLIANYPRVRKVRSGNAINGTRPYIWHGIGKRACSVPADDSVEENDD